MSIEKQKNPIFVRQDINSYWLILFFIIGFFTWLNGSLMPFVQTACELTPFEASLVILAFYIAYFIMVLPSSFVLKKTGYKNGIFLGLFVMAIGALMFIPAAYSRQFIVFLSGLFLLGTGLALLQTATNPFLTIIGTRESAAKRIAIMGIAGGALIPPTYAKIGQSIGFQSALWIMVPIYLFIFYYAVAGHKIRR